MTTSKSDPLLTGAKVVLAILMGLCVFAALMMVLGAAAAPLFGDAVVEEIVAEGNGPVPEYFFYVLAVMLLGIASLLAGFVYFLLLLWRIIGTVGEGDPFVPENARRLSTMGWIILACNVVGLVIGAVLTYLARIAEGFAEIEGFEADFDSGGSLLLILVLFILARVFRKGTQMHEELEGTV